MNLNTLKELQRGLQEDCDSASGPEAELSDTGNTGGDSPSGTEAQGQSCCPQRLVLQVSEEGDHHGAPEPACGAA